MKTKLITKGKRNIKGKKKDIELVVNLLGKIAEKFDIAWKFQSVDIEFDGKTFTIKGK